MKIRSLLLLFLAACASPEPTRREFHDGPMVRPAPAFVTPGHTPAGAGLPEYVPGSPAPVSRGTDRRVLPPTKEPGVWASDSKVPRTPHAFRMFFGVEFPLAPEEFVPYGDQLTNGCAGSARTVSQTGGLVDRIYRLSDGLRRCLAARIYARCAARQVAEHEKRRDTLDAYTPEVLSAQKAVSTTATAFKELACEGVELTDESEDLYTIILNRMENPPDAISE